MNISLKVISLLLSYPTEELLQAMPELKAALASDTLIGEREKAAARQTRRRHQRA